MRRIENKSGINYCSFYTIQRFESRPIKAQSKKCEDYPFGTPYHLRASYDKELKNMIEGYLIELMDLEESEWCSRAFPVLKSNGTDVRVVTDFKNISRNIKKQTHSTKSSSQLLRHIKDSFKYFVTLDMTSGYHQIGIDKESSKLLLFATPSGRYKMKGLAQGITSASSGQVYNEENINILDVHILGKQCEGMIFALTVLEW